MLKLDSLDRNLLKHLQKDGKLSLRELGRKLDVPHTTVFTRINRLVDTGIIKKFQAILNPHDLGLSLKLFIIEPNPNTSDQLIQSLSDFSEVMTVFKTEDGKIILKTISPKDDPEALQALHLRLYGQEYNVLHIGEILKYEQMISEKYIDQIE